MKRSHEQIVTAQQKKYANDPLGNGHYGVEAAVGTMSA
jgi:hypothetical protein